jgi:hypothetical protein
MTTIITDLVKALGGVIAVADRETVEFQFAREVLARAEQQLDLDRAEQWRHKKRGTTYSIVGDVRVQCETPLQDDEMVLLYQSTHDDSYGCRRHSEFHDGRFEKTK